MGGKGSKKKNPSFQQQPGYPPQGQPPPGQQQQGPPPHHQQYDERYLIPRTSLLVDDVSYDLWKGSGGVFGAAGFGRGLGERYENGDWCVHHPHLTSERCRLYLSQQNVDTFGVYGGLWSSAVRPVTAFGLRITTRELRSLRDGVYVVGLTPFRAFRPDVRPHRDAWLPALLCTERGTVSLAGERAQYRPWTGNVAEVGFVVQVGSGSGRLKVTVYVNDELCVQPTEISFPHEDSLHLFCFLNFVGDCAELLPHWRPSEGYEFAATIPQEPPPGAPPPGQGPPGYPQGGPPQGYNYGPSQRGPSYR